MMAPGGSSPPPAPGGSLSPVPPKGGKPGASRSPLEIAETAAVTGGDKTLLARLYSGQKRDKPAAQKDPGSAPMSPSPPPSATATAKAYPRGSRQPSISKGNTPSRRGSLSPRLVSPPTVAGPPALDFSSLGKTVGGRAAVSKPHLVTYPLSARLPPGAAPLGGGGLNPGPPLASTFGWADSGGASLSPPNTHRGGLLSPQSNPESAVPQWQDLGSRKLALTNAGNSPAMTHASGPANTDSSPAAWVSKLGGSAAVSGQKFIYLIPRERDVTDPHNPYDLKVVKHSHIERTGEYFTLSGTGMTHYRNGEVDFTALNDWLAEYNVFSALSSIPFFMKYRRWRCFYYWRRYLRRTTVANCKAFLNENLFILNRDLSSPLVGIRDICLTTQHIHLYEPSYEPLQLPDYVEKQQQSREQAIQQLNGITDAIRKLIDAACKDCVRRNSPVVATDGPPGGGAVSPTSQEGSPDEAEKEKPVIGLERESYIEQSQRRAVCRRLTAFIRLCDYMMADSLVVLALKSVADFLHCVRFPRDDDEYPVAVQAADPAGSPASTGVYTLDISFDAADGVVVTPTLEHLVRVADNIVQGFLAAICNLPRFLKNSQFKKYTRSMGADQQTEDGGAGPDTRRAIERTPGFVEDVARVHNSLKASFGEVEIFAKGFDPFRQMYVDNCLMDRDEVKDADHPLDWFRDEIHRFKVQADDVDRIENEATVAIFAAHTDSLKQKLQPSPKKCLSMLQELLPEIAREKNSALLSELQEATAMLAAPPTTVEEYVKYDAFHATVSEQVEQFRARFEFIKDMYREMDIGEPRIEYSKHDSLVFFEGSKPEFEKLQALIASVDETKEALRREFAEKVDVELARLKVQLQESAAKALNPMIDDEMEECDKVIAYCKDLLDAVEALRKREKELVGYQDAFQVSEATPIEEIADIHRDIADKYKVWQSLKDWQTITEEWKQTSFASLDAAAVEAEAVKYDKTVKQVDRNLKNCPVVPKLRSLVDAFRLTVPVITCLKNPDLKDHHWSQIDEIVGKDLSSDASTWTLGVLIDLNAMDLREEISAVSYQATQEQLLNEMLSGVIQTWVNIEFAVNPYKDQKDAFILGQVDDIQEQMEDSMVVISTISTNRYCSGVLKQRVERWEQDMKYMQECLDKWLEVQRKWMYLESVFSNAELQRQWVDDSRSFLTVDKLFRDLLKKTHDNPNVKTTLLGNNNTLLAQFKKDIESLERIEKRLEDKLEQKRRLFPRFYFLSNDDLLDILAQIKSPEKIAPHTLKMFDGVKFFTLTESADLTCMNSVEGEVVPVTKPIKARGPVEKWLLEAEGVMVQTLRKLAKVAVDDCEVKPRVVWAFDHPVQLVLTVSMIYWQKAATDALTASNPKEQLTAFKELCYTQLRELAAKTGDNLTKVGRRMLATLILLDVHGRDLVNEMVRENVVKVSDFGWTKQLRCYWELDHEGLGDVFIRQNNSEFTYGYEYMGAQGRLVITPLTDRIFMTITGALHLCLGASPSGPAGTGKTESVKDLAKGLGRLCIVYNCSDGVTYKMMEKFFSGLCQTGAWCCLDEFNRINIEVLSVVAQQLMEVREALLSQKDDPAKRSFTFQGTAAVELKSTFGCFITMNPGYAGRTELPDNLKALFRPVAAMTPDFRMIAEVIFYSEGFANAENLSLKITQLYKLSSEQLSPQHHYDFGMRALKSILVMAGDLKRSQPDTDEDLTLIIACNDANIPKFVADDIPLFQGIMSDLFPGVDIPLRDYPELVPAIRRDMEAKQLQEVDSYVIKVLQFYETLIVRHGVMFVGSAGGGKTEARQILAGSLIALHEQGSANPQAQMVHQHVLNPKSISMGDLYGSVDPNTNEWQDGILPIVVKQNRTDADAGSTAHEWIVFDGPVDTLWVESMNSVLDDSKLLCLDNGVRMKLPDTVHMLFEVADLAVASPATVSRCGMVFMDAQQLGWAPVIYTWIRKKMTPFLGPRGLAYLAGLCEAKLAKGLPWLAKCSGELLRNVDVQVVQSCCDLFHALCVSQSVVFPAENLDIGTDAEDSSTTQRNELIHLIFSFAFVWSVGGNLDAQHQEIFDQACRTMLEDVAPFSGPLSVYDCQIDFKSRRFIGWDASVPDFHYNPAMPYFDILVPTVDTVRYSYLLKTLLVCDKPVLFSGLTGTGKSVIIQQTLGECREELNLVNVTLQFSAKTSSPRTQDIIETKLKAKRKNILGAPVVEGQQMRVALFVDDLNMPALEQFGASPPVELIRQMMGNGGFYDRKYLFWKHVQDVVVVSACGPPEGGRSSVTQRLTRLFHLLQVPNLSEDSMKKIFTAIVNGFFAAQPFHADVKALIKATVSASVDVFQAIRDKLRPRPVTAHYTFNLRDLSKVFQGIMQVTPRTCSSSLSAAKLWIHENLRCFSDRLINEEDRRVFTEDIIMPTLTQYFPGKWDYNELFVEKPIVWGDFLVIGADEKRYEEVPSIAKLPALFENYLDEYNIATNKSLQLVFFADHCLHLARIVRVMRQPRGNALLVGVGGSGKQTLTRLAASIVEFQLFQIEVDGKYSIDRFHEDLLELYVIAGVETKAVVFLLNDTQIMNEGMTEDINNMLNSGEVPALFTPEEKDKKINACTQAAQTAGRGGTRDDIFAFFISRVRDNLRCVLCMSPVGDAFRTRCRNFPSLTNCCSIDWYDMWPTEALQQVAQRQLAEADLENDSADEGKKKAADDAADLRQKLTDMCVYIHQSVSDMAQRFFVEINRHYYVTPTSYLEFLSVYLTLLEDKKKELGEQLHKVANGKKKMNETTLFISNMQKEITDMKPILEQKSVENAEMMKEIEVRKEQASTVRVSVSAQEAEASTKAGQAQAIQQSAQADLDQATPALNDAVRALELIDKKDINEMRAYPSPPLAVEKTMNAVMILLKKPKFEWKLAKEVMSDPQFIPSLKNYDRDAIDEGTVKKLAKFVVDDPDFVPDKIGSQGSAACKSLCMWCRALHIYYYVAKEVAPKKVKLAAAQEELAETNAKLAEAQGALKSVEDEMAQLQSAFDESVKNKEDLQHKLETAQRHLATAEVLMDSLGAEVVRWDAMITRFKEDMVTLPANVFLASASIAYFGAFSPSFRAELVAMWVETAKERGLPIAPDYSLSTTLGDPMQIREWQIMSLPTDQTSTENAILVQLGTDEAMKLRRWPLMIDPQGQANRWIRRMEGKNGLIVVKMTDPRYSQVLKNAVQNGTPLLIDDVGETLDPAMESVLLKQVYSPSSAPNQLYINIGSADNAVPYEHSFRLYMTTKIANPHYLPEVCIKVTLINFTVTPEGLEDQMLGDVVSLEEAELEDQKNKIVKSVADDKRKLKRYEDLILSELEDAKGNILDNQKLIDTLKQAQSTSVLLSKRLVEAEEKAKKIEKGREFYRPVARRASILFFVIADLPIIDPMYQYSLDYFKKLVSQVVTATAKDSRDRLKSLIEAITEASYSAVCRGLFNRHKTVYSLLIAAAIGRTDGQISRMEWLFFNRAAALVAGKLPAKPASLHFVAPQVWGLLDALERSVPAFKGLLSDIEKNAFTWEAWFGLKEPQEKEPPNGAAGGADWSETLSDFQKLLLLRSCREEKMLFAVTNYVARQMGEAYITAPPLNLNRALADSAPGTPVIFILSQGSDPTDGFVRWADEVESRKIKSISLGQGQEKPARLLIEAGKKAGDWVLLQNCHLGKSFMPGLNEIVIGLESDKAVKEGFRLWLTSMPATYFPVPVLQNSVKLTNEAPSGIKANLKRCFGSIKEEELGYFATVDSADFAECSRSHAFKKLVFAACFFHSLVLERKKFGALGWNVKYEWNDTDINTSLKWLKLFISENEEIPWTSMQYIIGEINYGGRVTDPIDRRCLHSAMRRCYVLDVLEESYAFSESCTYRAPQDGPYESYMEYIESLPRNDSPEVFGLHDNASLRYQLQESQDLLSAILLVQPRVTGGAAGGVSPEELVKKRASEILSQMPSLLSLSEAGPHSLTFMPNGLPNSLSTVLRHEVESFSRLQGVINHSLVELGKALAGLTVLSEALDKMFQDFLSDKVPAQWSAASYPSLKPLGAWLNDLLARLIFSRTWLREGEPKSFWLPGFYSPHGFMTGILQGYARQCSVSVDLLGFSFTVLNVQNADDVEKPAASGVYVHGLCTDSFVWNSSVRVMEDSKDGEMYSVLPVIHFLPEENHKTPARMYQAPLYITTLRKGNITSLGASSNFILFAEIPTERDSDYWIQKGAALVCQLND
ncbi:Dynein-1-beta heavy chain [Diplonema papillatum]|nr:Dynein-1-beta heavy chain [Diplonema papillatum]